MMEYILQKISNQSVHEHENWFSSPAASLSLLPLQDEFHGGWGISTFGFCCFGRLVWCGSCNYVNVDVTQGQHCLKHIFFCYAIFLLLRQDTFNNIEPSSAKKKLFGAKWERMLDLRGVCNSMPMTSHEFTIKLMAFSHQKRWQCREKFSRISEWKFYWFSKAEILSLLTTSHEWLCWVDFGLGLRHTNSEPRRCRLGREGQAWGALRRVLMAETWNLLPPPSYFFVLLSTFGLLVCLSLHCLSRFQRHTHKMWTFFGGKTMNGVESTFGFSLCQFALPARWAVRF